MEKRFYIICVRCGSYGVATTRRDGFAYAYHFEVERGMISRTCYLGKMIKRNPIDKLLRHVRFKYKDTVLSARIIKKKELERFGMI
jgi:hypothetical protein